MSVSDLVAASARSGGWRRRAAVAVLVGAAGALRAADAVSPTPAPSLDEIKQDLKAMKRGDNLDLNNLSAGLKAGLPKFQPMPEASAVPTTEPGPPSSDQRPRKPAGTNWLLDAMNARDRQTGARRGTAAGPGRSRDPLAKPLDPDDPSYLLKLYLAQEQEGGGAAPDRDRRGPGGSRNALREVDPLEPFLSQWLSARDLDLLGPNGAAGPHAGQIDAAGPVVPFAPRAFEPPPAPAPNPYLEALKPDLPPAAMAGPEPGPPAAPVPALAPLPPVPAAPLSLVPPPPAVDDQKYFPQLNRF